jgi:hypothetical protein
VAWLNKLCRQIAQDYLNNRCRGAFSVLLAVGLATPNANIRTRLSGILLLSHNSKPDGRTDCLIRSRQPLEPGIRSRLRNT